MRFGFGLLLFLFINSASAEARELKDMKVGETYSLTDGSQSSWTSAVNAGVIVLHLSGAEAIKLYELLPIVKTDRFAEPDRIEPDGTTLRTGAVLGTYRRNVDGNLTCYKSVPKSTNSARTLYPICLITLHTTSSAVVDNASLIPSLRDDGKPLSTNESQSVWAVSQYASADAQLTLEGAEAEKLNQNLPSIHPIRLGGYETYRYSNGQTLYPEQVLQVNRLDLSRNVVCVRQSNPHYTLPSKFRGATCSFTLELPSGRFSKRVP